MRTPFVLEIAIEANDSSGLPRTTLGKVSVEVWYVHCSMWARISAEVRVRAPILLVAVAITASTFLTASPADAQRVARPRVIASRPVTVVRPARTVFIGGYYYPAFYRTSLFYRGGWGYDPWFYGPAYSFQFPIYGPYARYDRSGSMRLQVSPQQTEVFVDGYYAGIVDDFDNVFQRLNVEPGEHELLLYLAGHRPFQQRIYLQPGKTFNIKHTMEPLGPGETAPPRPPDIGAPPTGPRADDEGGRVGRAGGRGGRGEGPGPGRGRQGAAPQGFGSLSLRVQPADAEVLIDGERWSGSLENERLVVQLGAGTHQIEIRKDGYRRYLTEIPVGNGQVRTLNVSLTKQ